MTDSKLTELLERAADQTEVGPPPLDALYAGASRRRRRRTVLMSAAAAATVVAVAGGTTLLTDRPGEPAPVTSPPSVEMRLVGVGHAAIAVPATWGTNQAMCRTSQKDTVVVDDPIMVPLCGGLPRKGVETVLLTYGRPPIRGFRADETFEIDGVPAQRERTTCGVGNPPVMVCSGAVGIPSLRVWFRADSATSAAEVDRILARIEIVPDRTGVPSYRSLSNPQGSAYAEVLREVGLKAKFTTTKSPNYLVPGVVMAASPAPGTMLKPGSTVTVTVAG